jgi:hypothetical protein
MMRAMQAYLEYSAFFKIEINVRGEFPDGSEPQDAGVSGDHKLFIDKL